MQRGEIHGLLGENGAGKSTLVKVISGAIAPDDGEVLLSDEVVPSGSPAAALAAGIGMLHQEPLVLRRLTVLENFVIGDGGRGVRIDRATARRELQRHADEYGFALRPNDRVEQLSIGEHQQLEMVRLLAAGVKVLILDEPTSAISAAQRDALFAALRKLATEGLSIILVSHKLEEVLDLCHRVTVLRHGEVTGHADAPLVTTDLVRLMFEADPPVIAPRPAAVSAPILEVRDVVAHEGTLTTEPLTVTVHGGEVVGLAGLEGSGQRALLRACAGLDEIRHGSVAFDGHDLRRVPPHDRPGLGVSYVPADRLVDGLVPGLTVAEHVLLADRARGLVDRVGARERAADRISAAMVKGTPDSTPESLSGGNQQRLLLGLLPDDVRLLLLEQPTRGLDLHSAAWVWEQLLQRRAAGAGILFSSADLEELLTVSDRILVLFAGRIHAEVTPATTTVDELGHLIGGTRVGDGGGRGG